jgi:hypothetical protein
MYTAIAPLGARNASDQTCTSDALTTRSANCTPHMTSCHRSAACRAKRSVTKLEARTTGADGRRCLSTTLTRVAARCEGSRDVVAAVGAALSGEVALSSDGAILSDGAGSLGSESS